MDADRAFAGCTVAAHLARGVSDIRQTPVAVIPTKRKRRCDPEGQQVSTKQYNSTESNATTTASCYEISLLFNNLMPVLSASLQVLKISYTLLRGCEL